MGEYNEEQRSGNRADAGTGKRLDRRTDQRLDTWKEIGAFFGRDERTVKRWEDQRGLPVHRVPGSGRGSVYAYTSELSEWLKTAETRVSVTTTVDEAPSETLAQEKPLGRGNVPAITDTLGDPAIVAEPSNIDTSVDPHKGTSVWVYAGAVVALILFAGAFWFYKTGRAAVTKTATSAAPAHVVDPQAQELYLKGIYYWHKRTPEGLSQAVDYFTQSIVRDPNYAPAYVGLADCYNLLREYTKMPPEEAYPRAKAAAERAIALDDSLSGAHSSLAFVDFYWSWDSASAEKEFKRAIELDSNSVVAHHWYATYLMHMDRFDDALAQIEIAQKLDPSSISALADKAEVLSYGGQRDEAKKLLKELETSDPNFLSPHGYLGGVYFAEKNYPAYLQEAKRYADLLKDENYAAVVNAGAAGFASDGREGMLRAMLAEEKKQLAAGQGSLYVLAETAAELGDKQEAMKYLDEAVAKHDERSIALRIDENLVELHKDPEFAKLLARVGLPPL
jgi:tetratricopeptide (TPR) repeat protein